MSSSDELYKYGRYLYSIWDPNMYFMGVYARDKLPLDPLDKKRNICFIINTDTSNLKGTHWIAVIIFRDRYGEVFDSLGQTPPSTLAQWMSVKCKDWKWNKEALQMTISELCGPFCIYYLCFRPETHNKLTLTDFINKYFYKDAFGDWLKINGFMNTYFPYSFRQIV